MGSLPTVLEPSIAGLELHRPGRMPWQRLLAITLSLALLIALGLVLREQGFARLRGALPHAPAFWIAFAFYYFALPVSEWVIYRRLWRLPPAAFAALLRKLVSNEMLLGYSGELSFYLYALRSGRLAASPFKAIKDVSILSAMAGNVATLLMVAVAWPIWRSWRPGFMPAGSLPSLGLLLALCVLLMVLRRRIFSLPPHHLRFVGSVHLIRVAFTTALLGIMWTAALPQVPVAIWIALAALQLVVSRLPFVPNKDIVFAGTAMLFVGQATPIGALMALVASLLVAAHLFIGLGLIVTDVAGVAENK
ncbi:MAG TPA: hypothetical protein VNT42_12065 [Sphingomonas sp.]|nr:hypothetical protein [Sphingomonas sp.]